MPVCVMCVFVRACVSLCVRVYVCLNSNRPVGVPMPRDDCMVVLGITRLKCTNSANRRTDTHLYFLRRRVGRRQQIVAEVLQQILHLLVIRLLFLLVCSCPHA
jgi:hypothetical protein